MQQLRLRQKQSQVTVFYLDVEMVKGNNYIVFAEDGDLKCLTHTGKTGEKRLLRITEEKVDASSLDSKIDVCEQP